MSIGECRKACVTLLGGAVAAVACDQHPRDELAPTERVQPTLATPTSAARDAAGPGLPIQVLEAEAQQSLLTSDPDDAEGCPLWLMAHVGEQDKAVAALVLHAPSCLPSHYLEQRVAKYVSDSYSFANFVSASANVAQEFQLAIEDVRALDEAADVSGSSVLPGPRGTFLVVGALDPALLVTHLNPAESCALLRDLARVSSSRELRSYATAYLKAVRCVLGPAPLSDGEVPPR